MSASVKTFVMAAVALMFLPALQGASAARASEKGQGAPETLLTEPSVTSAPAQQEREQPAPENLITEPSVTSAPAQPEREQTPPETLITEPTVTSTPAQEMEQAPPENLLTAPSPTIPPPRPLQEVPELSYVDMLHSEIVRRLLASAVWMDSFFADTDYVKEVNRSYARFRYEIFKEERSGATYKPAVDLRLALPELEKKTHLIITADPAEPAAGEAAPVRTAGERFGTSAQNTVTTALQYVFRSDPQVSSLVRTGLQFVKFEPVIFLAPRYRVLMPYDTWALRFTQEVIWKSRGSWQTDTRFDFERPLPHELFFRTSIDGVWAAQVNGYAYSLAFGLRQPLTPTHALDYEWINSYNTRPVGELTEIAFRVRYRHSYLRDWLFFELAPQVRFPRDANFNSTAGILFKLEVFFGKT